MRKAWLFGMLLAAALAGAAQPCDTATLPWREDFDAYGYGTELVPACWTATRNFDMGYAPHLDGGASHSGQASLALFPGTLAESHYSMVIGPALSASSLEGYHLRFFMRAASTASHLEVGLCADTGRYTRAFVAIDTVHPLRGGVWEEHVVDLSRYAGAGRRVAFRLKRALQADAGGVWIDDVSVSGCGTTQPTVSHIASRSAMLRFDAYGYGDVVVSYGAHDTLHHAVSPLLLEGLSPQTAYTVSVGCEGGEVQTVSFTTMEGAFMVPAYYEDFAAAPARWRYPLPNRPAVQGGVLRMAVAADSCLAVMPLQEAVPTAELNVGLSLSATGSARLLLGVMEYAEEAGSFVEVDTFGTGRTVVSLAPYGGTGRYLALMAVGSGTVEVDDLRVARCLVDGLRAYGLSDTSVTLGWDTLTLPAPPMRVVAGDSVTAVASNPFRLGGLVPATPYTIYLAPACGDDTCAYDRISFTTFAHEVSPPYCATFEESAALPQGWVCTKGRAVVVQQAYTGHGALQLAAGSCATLPQLGPHTADTVVLELVGRGSGMLEVGVQTTPYAPFQPADTLRGTTWTRHALRVAGLAGKCLALRVSGQWVVDDLSVRERAVNSAWADSVGHHSALLRWSGSAASVRVEYKKVGSEAADFAPGSGTEATAAGDVRLEGLEAGSWYCLHVGPDDGCTWQTLHLRTLPAAQAVPYCINFDQSAAYPDEWRRLSAYGEYPIVSSERNRSQGRSLRFSATASRPTVALLPDFESVSGTLSLSFWSLAASNASGALLLVGTLANSSDAGSFVPTDTVALPSDGQWHHCSVALGGRHSRLAIALVGANGAETRVFVDDLCVEPCRTYGYSITSTDTTLTLRWQSEGVAGLEYSYVRNGVRLTDTATASPVTLGGLLPGTAYGVRLRTLCGCGGAGGTHANGSTGAVASDTLHTFSVHTLPQAVATPWCADFEATVSGNMPYGWNRSGTVAVSDQNYHRGTHSLRLAGGATAVLPPVLHPQALAMSLHAYAVDEAGTRDGALTVGVVTSPDSLGSFIPLESLSLSHIGQWEQLAIDLGGYGGEGRFVAIRTAAGCTLFVDDISLDTALVWHAGAAAGGLLEWTAVGRTTRVAVEYGPSGFERGSGLRDTADASPHRIATDPSGNYDFYLSPVGGCQVEKTSLGSATALPYCENFDDAPPQGMANEWATARAYGGTPSLAAEGGGQVLCMKAHPSGRSIAVLPPFAVGSFDSVELSLSMKCSRADNAMLIVGVMSDAYDPNTFIGSDTLQATASGRWQRVVLPLAWLGGSLQGRLALACASASGEVEVRVDSLSVSAGTTPTVVAVSARRLRVESSRTGYYIEYGPAGTVQGQGTVVKVNGAVAHIGGLVPSSEYWIYSRTDSAGATCKPPLHVCTPGEAALPFCVADTTFSTLLLPEPATDSLRRLQLYAILQGGDAVAVGVMERGTGWDGFVPIDTLAPPFDGRVSFSSYRGDGRFIALRTLYGGNADARRLMLTDCVLPTATLLTDNTVRLTAGGWVDYGHGRFPVEADTIVGPLADTTDYDFHFYCSAEGDACDFPQHLRTTYLAALPYCADTAGGLLPSMADTAVYVRYRLPSGAAVAEWVPNPSGRVGLPSRVYGLEVAACRLPDSLKLSQLGAGVVEIGWPAGWDGFYVEYVLHGQPQGSGTTLRAMDGPLRVGLLPDTLYDFYVRCDSLTPTCRPPQRLATLSLPVGVPYCNGFSQAAASLPKGWRELKDKADNYVSLNADGRMVVRNYGGVTYAVLPQFVADSLRHLAVTLWARFLYSNGHTLTLGTLTDADSPDSFDSIASFTSMGGTFHRCFFPLADYYGEGRFLALRVADDDLLEVDSIQVSACAAYDFAMEEREADYAVFSWKRVGEPSVRIEYGPRGFAAGSGTVVHPTASPFRLEGLSALTEYAFYVQASCGEEDCSFVSPTDTFFTFTPMGAAGCIDYTNLSAPYVNCSYGTYANPMQHMGMVDYGYLSAASRHTVHFDTAERDARTQGLLRTVPTGSQASVRLGNWATGGNGGPQAESITYGMTVDANNAGLLVLRYAAVLQDPEHGATLQPRFRLQILNSEGLLIDSCSMADFIANASLDWNQAPNEVLWKDWTTVGLDLTPYAGQTIFVRLTTHDCGEGSHFGYAYFTLGCASKRMESEGCSDVPNNRFTVPSGFRYRWYTNRDTATLSDSSSIWVASDNTLTYFCDLTFVDNPACGFTMSAFAGARFPLALFDTSLSVADCRFSLRLKDGSTISGDGHTPLGTGEPCEEIWWLLPDGTTSSDPVVDVPLSDTGQVSIALVASIAGGQCTDTLRRTLGIAYPHPAASTVGDTVRCDNDAPTLVGIANAVSYQWADGLGSPLRLTPLADTLLQATATDSNGCMHTLSHPLHVFKSYHFPTTDSICATQTGYSWHDTLLAFAPDVESVTSHLLARRTAEGCDSLHRLTLTHMPAFYPHEADTLCYASSARFFDTTLRSSGTYVHPSVTAFGCDSITTLHLTVLPPNRAVDRRVVCDSLRWIDGVLYRRSTNQPTDTLADWRGCDSVVRLDLTVNFTRGYQEFDTACQRDPYLWRGRTLPASGFYADTLTGSNGCDSVMAIHLTLLPTPYVAINYDYDCRTLIYTLRGETDAPYYYWSSSPADSLMASLPPLELWAEANPAPEATYTLTADYRSTPRCPERRSVTLQHPSPPQAVMRVSPQALTDAQLSFDAYDMGAEYVWRRWLVGGEEQAEQGRHMSGMLAQDADTLLVQLVVGDGHCADTASTRLPVRRWGVAMPNVFTPGSDDDNALFIIASYGIGQGTVRVYNRNGLLVYQSDDIKKPWDGTDLQGRPCPTGSYVVHVAFTTRYQPSAWQRKVQTVVLVR